MDQEHVDELVRQVAAQSPLLTVNAGRYPVDQLDENQPERVEGGKRHHDPETGAVDDQWRHFQTKEYRSD